MSIYTTTEYPYGAEFLKYFHGGALKGMTIRDTLYFISKESAEDWAREVTKKKFKYCRYLDIVIYKRTTNNW